MNFMKRFFTLMLVGALIFACKSEKKEATEAVEESVEAVSEAADETSDAAEASAEATEEATEEAAEEGDEATEEEAEEKKLVVYYPRDSKLANETDEAIKELYKSNPTIQQHFYDAYGFAVYPKITKGGLGVGGAGGKGLVFEDYKVIGVVEDYNYQSLKRSIQPVVHFFNPEVTNRLAVRLDPERLQEGIALLERKWNAMDPYEPFDYSFVDESFDELYKEQERLGTTSSLFSLIAIVIAGLGLFSITSYTLRIRKKEIGIRMVLGASLASIITDLSRNLGLLIFLAFYFYY